MIRVLFIRRHSQGDLAEYSDTLADALDAEGVEAVVDDAEGWIPSKTGWMVDRKVTRELKRAAQGFDLIHAFGYRAAWACSEAFYVRQPWLYTAFDMPKTKHPHLIDRLNAARRGLCSSRAVRDALKSAEALHLDVFSPCVSEAPPLDSPATLKTALGLTQGEAVVCWSGGTSPAEGLDSLLAAFPALLPFCPQAYLVVAPWEPLTPAQEALVKQAPDRVRILGPKDSQDLWLKASDLFVATRKGAGFSMAAARAMLLGTPVLLRRDGGLAEMAADGETGFFFDVDSELPEKIRLILESPLSAEAVGGAGRVRAEDRFDAATAASVLSRTYRDLLDR